jgi:N-acetylglutamate synthase-like GNAT family acetyltransferase
VRKATAGDAGAIAALIDADAGEVAAVLRGKTSVLVAQRADIIGCVAWQAIPTLQHGLIGRLTLIFVANDERRRKVGSALVEAARTELAKLGCALIEAISDIEIDNAHGFFRALGFNQASYRFTIG